MIREAKFNDLASIVALTKANRKLRARLHGDYWPPAKRADEIHAKYLSSLLNKPDVKKLVLEKGGRVIGFAVVQPRSSFFFVDDICLASNADLRADGAPLCRAIVERPAIPLL